MSALRGLSVVITSGPTREHLDPIRFLTNASSGRMGFALAREAARRGARVAVVSGPTDQPAPSGARVVPVVTALEMRRETLKRARRADVVIGAAAVSDWRFASTAAHKLKTSKRRVRLTLLPNPDIIKEVATSAGRPRVVVGFALETRRALAYAKRKLAEKNLDLVVANGPQSLRSDRSRAALVTRRGVKRLAPAAKTRLAAAIFDELERLLVA